MTQTALALPKVSDVELLRRVRDRLTPEDAWTQGFWARGLDRRVLVPAFMDRATCWCLGGAALMEDRAHGDHRIARLLGFDTSDAMFRWQDDPHRSQAEVLALLDQAIGRTTER